jgi:hypothetical protein
MSTAVRRPGERIRAIEHVKITAHARDRDLMI